MVSYQPSVPAIFFSSEEIVLNSKGACCRKIFNPFGSNL